MEKLIHGSHSIHLRASLPTASFSHPSLDKLKYFSIVTHSSILQPGPEPQPQPQTQAQPIVNQPQVIYMYTATLTSASTSTASSNCFPAATGNRYANAGGWAGWRGWALRLEGMLYMLDGWMTAWMGWLQCKAAVCQYLYFNKTKQSLTD